MPLTAFDAAMRATAEALLDAPPAPLVLHDRSETLRAVQTTKYGRQDNDPEPLAAALRSGDAAALKRALMPPEKHGSGALPTLTTLRGVVLSPEGTAFPTAAVEAEATSSGATLASASGFAVQSCGHLPREAVLQSPVDSLPMYDEVLVLTHRWSSNPYHYLGEAREARGGRVGGAGARTRCQAFDPPPPHLLLRSRQSPLPRRPALCRPARGPRHAHFRGAPERPAKRLR